MPASSDPSSEIRSYFADRFGISEAVLDRMHFAFRGDDVWAATVAVPEGIRTARPVGLHAARRTPHGWRPTGVFLICLGDAVAASRVEICDVRHLREFLQGRPSESCAPTGYVAVAFRGDVLGCGLVDRGRLRVQIPTGRRRELLEALRLA